MDVGAEAILVRRHAGTGTFGRRLDFSVGSRMPFASRRQRGPRWLVEPAIISSEFCPNNCRFKGKRRLTRGRRARTGPLTRLNSYSAVFLSSGFALSG